MNKLKVVSLFCALIFLSSCASTGPKVTKEEMSQYEQEFNNLFLQVGDKWNPKVYRVAYRLLTSPVPGHAPAEPKFNFVGIGVDPLKSNLKRSLNAPPSLRGVLVNGLYPGSQAEFLDIQSGDVITKVDNKKVKSVGSFHKRIRKTKKKTVTMEIYRQGQLLQRVVPVEKVYYNAKFNLAPTPNFEASARISTVQIGIGTLRYCQNDDELAVIMGHELAHVSLKHSHKTLATGLGTNLAFYGLATVVDAFTFTGVGGILTSPMEQATDAAISRRYEREADYFGLRHAYHAGYQVENGAEVFSRLGKELPSYNILAYTFSTHPKWAERYVRLQKTAEELRTNYPEKYSPYPSPDWDYIVPIQPGENLRTAVENLLRSEPTVTEADAFDENSLVVQAEEMDQPQAA